MSFRDAAAGLDLLRESPWEAVAVLLFMATLLTIRRMLR